MATDGPYTLHRPDGTDPTKPQSADWKKQNDSITVALGDVRTEAVGDVIADDRVVKSTDSRLPITVAADESIVIFKDADGNRTFLDARALDGGPTRTAATLIGTPFGLDPNSAADGLLAPVTIDAAGNLDWRNARTSDGGPMDWAVDLLSNRIISRRGISSGWVIPELDSGSLYAVDIRSGQRTLITAAAAPRNAYPTGTGAIVFTTDNGVMAWTPDGQVRPAFATTATMFGLGDSLTAEVANGGNGYWLEQLGSTMGVAVRNLGIAGQTTTHLAIRWGALPLMLTVTGGSIPASGPVNVTASSPAATYAYPASTTWSMPGTIAGVHGSLLYGPNASPWQWTFTRDTTGSAVPVSGVAQFLPDPAHDAPTKVATDTDRTTMGAYWGGRNNLSTFDLAVVQRDDTAIMAMMGAAFPKTLILGVTTTTTEDRGSAGYANAAAVNAWRASQWPDQFVDIRRWLVDNGLALLSAQGITPTASDLARVSFDNIPNSLHTDSTHFTQATQRQIGDHIADLVAAKGWG